MLTAALFIFDAGPENAMEHPVKLHPLRITGSILFPGQLERDDVAWLIVEVVSLDTDTVAKLDFSQLDKVLEMSTSCASEVRSYVTGLQWFCGQYTVVLVSQELLLETY